MVEAEGEERAGLAAKGGGLEDEVVRVWKNTEHKEEAEREDAQMVAYLFVNNLHACPQQGKCGHACGAQADRPTDLPQSRVPLHARQIQFMPVIVFVNFALALSVHGLSPPRKTFQA